MQSRIRLIIAGMSAALLMALAAGSASASLSVSHQVWQATFNPLNFRSSGLTAAECPVTLVGSFHSRTIFKVERSLVGFITRASVGTCGRGSATVLTETLPWHVQYLGFTGRLPDILRIRLILVGASFQIRDAIFGSVCLTRTTEAAPASGDAELENGEGNRNVLALRADENPRIRCGSLEGSFAGTATVVEPETGTRLLVRLI